MAHHKLPTTMKALQWEGVTNSISLNTLPTPILQDANSAIIKLTHSAICGSDLHIYHNRSVTPTPLTLGHENIGVIVSLGSAITSLKAEYLHVPSANDNLLKLPEGKGKELDYLLLADIWPTSWFALESAGQVFGDTVVVFGAGPVGLLCAYSALLRGATKVYSVDHVPSRLAKAKSIGAIPINFMTSDPVAQIAKLEPNGVDRACDCVGYECVNEKGVNDISTVLTWGIQVLRSGGGFGVIGVYIPNDPNAPTAAAKNGLVTIPFGTVWLKSLSIKGGLAEPRPFQEVLKKLIDEGKAKPSFVFEKTFGIEEGPMAYREFSDHKFVKCVIRFEHGEAERDVENGVEEGRGSRKRARGE
ncbi:hypothetical protein B7494_g5019 [Chlorociboria aeruginascens]|nr:hypothetical protein B7494_g5019 [Chlorociboria aeruginascens]